MNGSNQGKPWRILIASSHPLFAKGLRSLLEKRREMDAVVVGLVSSIDEALTALGSLHPDLVIVDYDDERVNRDEFLARFVEGEGRLRVVLLSLKEGGSEAIVYDRRTMAASQIDEWLEMWNENQAPFIPPGVLAGEGIPQIPKPKRRDSMKHFIAAAFMVIALMAAGLYGYQHINLLPDQASLQAASIDNLFGIHFRAIIVLFSLIVGLMVYSILVFRRKAGDTSDGPHMEGNTKLEVAWTILPLGAVLVLAYIGGITLGDTQALPDQKPLQVKVVGSQWSWRFEYPELGIISTELVLPVDKQALLELSSTDVIHSFWVPEFRVKQDALPGEDFVRELRVTPTQIGEFKVRCAELCGRLHHAMESPVKVIAQQDFDAWVKSKTVACTGLQECGNLWYEQFGCQACHTIDGSPKVGPSWKGIYGNQESLSDGTSALVDHDYIVESIRNPGAKITAGFQNLMPANIAANMTDDQIEDVIAFIESLK